MTHLSNPHFRVLRWVKFQRKSGSILLDNQQTVLVNVGKCIQIYPNHYLDYFTIEELLQNSIKYGHYLMALYGEHKGENNGYGRYYEMRQFLSLTVADI